MRSNQIESVTQAKKHPQFIIPRPFTPLNTFNLFDLVLGWKRLWQSHLRSRVCRLI